MGVMGKRQNMTEKNKVIEEERAILNGSKIPDSFCAVNQDSEHRGLCLLVRSKRASRLRYLDGSSHHVHF